ncbi:MAG: hypothetical protein MJ007_02075 [Paludibacteraceae bacterium]|nr:hypothetical protein [Paludibacteraceae bacterium]
MPRLIQARPTGWKRHPFEYEYLCDICKVNTRTYDYKRTNGTVKCTTCQSACQKARQIQKAMEKERDLYNSAIDTLANELKIELAKTYGTKEDFDLIDSVVDRVRRGA